MSNMLNEGYSNHWNIKREFTDNEWELIKKWAVKVFALSNAHGVKVCNPLGVGQPTINDKLIAFNGDKDLQLDYEDCTLRKDKPGISYSKTGSSRALPYDQTVTTFLWGVHEIAPDAIELASDGGPSVFKNWFSHDKPIEPPKVGTGTNQAKTSEYSYKEISLKKFNDWFIENYADLLSKAHDLFCFKPMPGLEKMSRGDMARTALPNGGRFLTAAVWAKKNISRATGQQAFNQGHKLVGQTPFLVGVGDTFWNGAKNIQFMVVGESKLNEETETISLDKMYTIIKGMEPQLRSDGLGVFVFKKGGSKEIIASVRPEYKMPYTERLGYHAKKTTPLRLSIEQALPVLIGIGRTPEEAKKNVKYMAESRDLFCTECGSAVNEGHCLCSLDKQPNWGKSLDEWMQLDEAALRINFQQLVSQGRITPAQVQQAIDTVTMMKESQVLRAKLRASDADFKAIKIDVVPILKKIGSYEQSKDFLAGLSEAYEDGSDLNKAWIAVDATHKLLFTEMQNPAAMKNFYDNELFILLNGQTKELKAIYSETVFKLLDGMVKVRAKLRDFVEEEEEAEAEDENESITEGLLSKIAEKFSAWFKGFFVRLSTVGKFVTTRSKDLRKESESLLARVKKDLSDSIIGNQSYKPIVSEDLVNETKMSKKTEAARKKVIKVIEDLDKLEAEGLLDDATRAKKLINMITACINEKIKINTALNLLMDKIEQEGYDFIGLAAALSSEMGLGMQFTEMAGEVYERMKQAKANEPDEIDEIIFELADGAEINFKYEHYRADSARQLMEELLVKCTKPLHDLMVDRSNKQIEKSFVDSLRMNNLNADQRKAMMNASKDDFTDDLEVSEGFFGDAWDKVKAVVKSLYSKWIGAYKVDKAAVNNIKKSVSQIQTLKNQMR
jgi:hypothetical protein